MVIYTIYLLSSERPRMHESDCEENRQWGKKQGMQSKHCLCFKDRSVELSGGRIVCETGFLGLEGH